MLFSAFALAVDRFVTIGRRTAQFCFGLLMRCLFLDSPSLRPSRLLTHATRRALCTLAGTWEQIRTKILRAFVGDDGRTLVATCLGTPSNSIIISRVPLDQKNSNALSVRLKLKTSKISLDDGWPESVEEQGLLLLVWRHHIRNNILKMCYRQSRRVVLRQSSRSARQ